MTRVTYAHPLTGGYADTVAVLDDGRELYVNTQYGQVSASHAPACAKSAIRLEPGENVVTAQRRVNTAACTCGALDGVDVAALLTDARIHGKFGFAPTPTPTTAPPQVPHVPHVHGANGWCDRCESHCYGDCEATR